MVVDQCLAVDYFLTTDIKGLGGDLFQAVDVVEKDTVEVIDRRIGIPGNSQINDEKRSSAAQVDQGSQFFRCGHGGRLWS